MAKLNTDVPVCIEKLSNEGRGMAYPQGHTTFVAGGLPGEQVKLKVLRKSKKIIEAVVTELLGPNHPDRVEPMCDHFLACGGCRLQHLDVEAQIQMKQQHFQQLWSSQLSTEPKQWAQALIGPSVGYRRSARLGMKWVHKKDKMLLGFRELDGRKILDMHMCSVLTPTITQHLFTLQQVLAQTSLVAEIPQLELASGDTEVAVIVRHLSPWLPEDLILLEQFAQQTGWHVWLQSHGPDSVKPLLSSSGLLHYQLGDQQLTLAFHPTDFIQVNADINQQMVTQAMTWLNPQPNEYILDLFCGLGNFSLAIARAQAHVVGVEGSLEMTLRAGHNAQLNQLADRCQFFAQNLEADYFDGPWVDRSYDKVLLDPPRSGAKACMPWLLKKRPKRIVYVSCHAATLVRDAEQLLAAGYVASHAGVMDMFPHTHHVEAMVCFDDQECS